MSSKEKKAWVLYWLTIIGAAVLTFTMFAGCSSSRTTIEDREIPYEQTGYIEKDVDLVVELGYETSGETTAPEPYDSLWSTKSEDGLLELTVATNEDGSVKKKAGKTVLNYKLKDTVKAPVRVHLKDSVKVSGTVKYKDTTKTTLTDYPFMSKLGWGAAGAIALIVLVLIILFRTKLKSLF